MNTAYATELPAAWQPAAAVFAALGDPMRQKILLLFEPEEELPIKDIAGAFSLSRTAIVHHLDVLHRAGVLSVRRAGKSALYSVRPGMVLSALDSLRQYIIETFPAPAEQDCSRRAP